MGYSSFSNGFSGGVIIRGLPLQQVQPGEVFYVNNSGVLAKGGIAGSNGSKGSYLQPFSTLDYAIGKCTAGRGDTIFLMPGHAETISSATALNLDVAGIAVIGLGAGTATPKFTLDTAATTTIPVSAANITIKNVRFSANFADITAVFTTTTAKNLCIDSCDFTATATNMNFLYIVDTDTTTNNTDGLWVINSVWVEPDLATLSLVKCDSINTGWHINNNDLNLGVNNNKASIIAIATGKNLLDLEVSDNKVYRLNTDTATGGILITTDVATNTGFVSHNHVQHADTAAEILVTATSGLGFVDNRASGVAGASGYLLPAADS